MEIYLISFVFMLVIMAGMAIGVIVANKPIKGSCGGMSALGIDTECDICGGNPKKCEEETARREAEEQGGKAENTGYEDLGYDATKK